MGVFRLAEVKIRSSLDLRISSDSLFSHCCLTTASDPANNSVTRELDDDDECEADDLTELRKRLTLWNLAPRRGRWASWNGEDVREFSKGVLKMVSLGSMHALSSFSSTTPLKYTMQFDPTHQHHHSLLPPLFVTRRPHKITKLNLTPIKKRPIEYLAVVRLKELKYRQQNTGSSSYHCYTSLIDADKSALLASPCSDVPVP